MGIKWLSQNRMVELSISHYECWKFLSLFLLSYLCKVQGEINNQGKNQVTYNNYLVHELLLHFLLKSILFFSYYHS